MNNKGFTLIELIMIIILLGILSATAVVLVGNVLEQQRFDETVKEMNELKKAMLGNPELISSGARSSFGYVGDMGSLPSSLTAVVEKGALPAFQKTGGTGGYDATLPDLGTGAGWRGPYIDNKKDDAGNYLALRDGWGTPYTYGSSTGQITSYGPDLASGGGDNIVIPETSVAGFVYGGVSGTVKGSQGWPVEGATVRIYYPNGSGAHTTWNKTTSSSGFYNFSSIPIGRRTIKVTSGSLTLSDTVVVDGGQTQTKDIVIADQIAPNPPAWANPTPNCGGAATTGGYPVNTSQINLIWTASSSPDVASYKIYRGTASGGEILYKSGVTGTSYTDNAATNTTYYYRISAVDTAGNESNPANTTGGSGSTGVPGEIGGIVAGPIYKRANSSWRNTFVANDTLRIPTTNSRDPNFGDNFAISSVSMMIGSYQIMVEWSGPATRFRRIRARTSGINIYDDGGACLGQSGIPVTATNTLTYNCNTDEDIEVVWCSANNTASSVTVKFGGTMPGGPYNGQLTGLPLGTWP